MIISKRDSIQGLCVSNGLQWLGCSVNTHGQETRDYSASFLLFKLAATITAN